MLVALSCAVTTQPVKALSSSAYFRAERAVAVGRASRARSLRTVAALGAGFEVRCIATSFIYHNAVFGGRGAEERFIRNKT